ncbi:MAG: N-acetyltransferase [Cyclobacteriaceae bacterium]|nr:N-acetyltransferase [Cyclobacteriaceae bacterium]
MEIKQRESGNKGAFYIEVDGKQEGEMTYSIAGTGRIIIDHTEVSDKLKGMSAGKQLVAAAVAHARKKNLKILPLCPFARAVFERTREYDDVSDL